MLHVRLFGLRAGLRDLEVPWLGKGGPEGQAGVETPSLTPFKTAHA